MRKALSPNLPRYPTSISMFGCPVGCNQVFEYARCKNHYLEDAQCTIEPQQFVIID